MPCIFCIAVFAIVAGALTAARIDQVERALEGEAAGAVVRTTDSTSATAFDLEVVPPGARRAPAVPVTVTVYKRYGRVRIQLRSHALDRSQAELLQDRLAAALGARIVERSDEAEEAPVRAALSDLVEFDSRGEQNPTRSRSPERRGGGGG